MRERSPCSLIRSRKKPTQILQTQIGALGRSYQEPLPLNMCAHICVQVCTCIWSSEDNCAYICAGVCMHVESRGQLCIHTCRCAHACGVPRTAVHTYVQVCACMWSPEDNCAYILQVCTCVWRPKASSRCHSLGTAHLAS